MSRLQTEIKIKDKKPWRSHWESMQVQKPGKTWTLELREWAGDQISPSKIMNRTWLDRRDNSAQDGMLRL